MVFRKKIAVVFTIIFSFVSRLHSCIKRLTNLIKKVIKRFYRKVGLDTKTNTLLWRAYILVVTINVCAEDSHCVGVITLCIR